MSGNDLCADLHNTIGVNLKIACGDLSAAGQPNNGFPERVTMSLEAKKCGGSKRAP